MTEGAGRRHGGSRFLYEPFDTAHARMDTHERVFEERWNALENRLSNIETSVQLLERRLWVGLYGVAVGIATQLAVLLITKLVLI